MIAETPKKSVKTLREVIIDIIAKRTGGSSSWTPPRQHIPRRPNPLHQVGGAA